jgi:hypothetical protein
MRSTASFAAVALGVLALVAAAVGSTTSTSADAATAPTTTGLVLSYGFDNDAGTVARDSSTNRINGTYHNTTAEAARSASVPGRGSAIRLDGTRHQWISVPERNALDVNRFTVAALVRYTGIQNDMTLGRWEVLEKAGAYWINVRLDGHVRLGGFFGGCTNPSWKYLDSTVAVPLNTWTHIAGTYNGSRLVVWINGVRAGGVAITGATCSNNEPLAVAAKNAPAKSLLEAFWDGQLDDIRIYRRALSATEMKGLLPS